MTRRRRTVRITTSALIQTFTVSIAALVFARAVSAQTPPAPAAAVVDVTVVDARGEPVADLGGDRFRVQVDGRSRSIVAAQFVRPEPSSGRSIVLVVDQNSVAPGAEAPLIEVVLGFIRRLMPGDRVGLVAVPAPGPHVELTTDQKSVAEAVGQVKGHRVIDPAASRIGLGEALAIYDGDTLAIATVGQRECAGIGDTIPASNGLSQGVFDNSGADCFKRVTRLVDRIAREGRSAAEPVVRGIVDAVAGLSDAPGARAVVVVTAGVATGRRDPSIGDLADRSGATGASVQALLLDPGAQRTRGVPINRQTERRSLEQRLDELTAAARGHAEVAGAASAEAFDRVLRETTGYYRVRVADDAAGRGAGAASGRGEAKRPPGLMRVDVTGANLTVRARPFLSGAPLDADLPSAPIAASRADRLAEALSTGGVRVSALPVRGAAAFQIGANRTPGLVIAGEVDLDQAGAGSPGSDEVAMSYALFDQSRQPVAAGPLPSGAMSISGGTRTFVGRLNSVAPGRYTLRLAAIDAGGRMGSVERDLDLRITEAAGIAAGHIVLARTARGQTEALPSADEIGVDSAVAMQVDVAADPAARRALTGRFVVRSRGGTNQLLALPCQVLAGEAAGVAQVVGTLEAGLLAPGDYEILAELHGPAGVSLTTQARALTLVAAVAGAAPTVSGASHKEWLAAITPSFSRARFLDAGVIRPVITRLQARTSSASVQGALGKALEAKPETLTVDEALRRQDPVAAAFLSGLALFARGELEPAALQFREALRGDAEFAPAIVFLGACYAAGGRDREAAGAWQTALISETEDPVLAGLLADAWLRVEDAEAALEILDEAVAHWPNDRGLGERRVTALLAAGRTADALGALDARADAAPDVLFAAMRVLFDAHLARRAIVSSEEDRRRLHAYANRYRAANGSQQALVATWIAAMP